MASQPKPQKGALDRNKAHELALDWHPEREAKTMPERRKAAKGTVVVVALKERLRLRWSYQARRYVLALELPDNLTNRKIAEAKARLIERDMATESFDPTLERYKPGLGDERSLSVVDLFQKFMDFKAKKIYAQSLEKYKALLGHLQQFFRQKSADQVGESDAEKFAELLGKRLEPITVRERISLVNACWKWAISKRLVRENPWAQIKVRVPRRAKPKPFTAAEIKKIVEGFRSDPDYSYYSDYVEFCLGTGCRIGEAIALKWKHLNENCSVVHFIEADYRGTLKGLKTEDERFVSLTPHLQKMLLRRRGEKWKPDDLVFPGKKGGLMRDQNFRKRAWKTVLERVGVEYRKPRTTRSTLASHALDQGMGLAEVSELTGHTIETLVRHYAGNVKNRPTLPDLLGD